MSWRRIGIALRTQPLQSSLLQRHLPASSASAGTRHLQDAGAWRTPTTTTTPTPTTTPLLPHLRPLSTPSGSGGGGYQGYQRPSAAKRQGIAHVQATFSNTVITVTDMEGNTKSWASSGSVGFKGCKRASKIAAQAAAEHVAKKAVQLGFGSVEVRLKGAIGGKESSVRGLQIGGLSILRIRDVTPVAHNGCRLPKKRRV